MMACSRCGANDWHKAGKEPCGVGKPKRQLWKCKVCFHPTGSVAQFGDWLKAQTTKYQKEKIDLIDREIIKKSQGAG
jgi:transposase-like protein